MTLRTSHVSRINAAIDYVDAHLAEPLDFQKLAAVAHFSPWHFHRLFQAMTGETLAERVRRRRLEAAAIRLLIAPPATVLGVALDVGFGSAEVFTRTFKAHFGVTPGAWRKGAFRTWAEQRRVELSRLHRDAHGTGQALDETFREQERLRRRERAPAAASVGVTLRTLPAAHVAYMRHIGPYGDPRIGRMWRRFVAWSAAAGMATGGAFFGVSHDSPDVTAPDKCRYDACVTVDAGFRPHGEIGVQDVAGGLYACTAFSGTQDRIYGAWLRLYGEWLPESDYQPDDRPAVEAYGTAVQLDADTGAFVCELCLPVRAM